MANPLKGLPGVAHSFGVGNIATMRCLIRDQRRNLGLPLVVALFQLALVTWIPVADAVHHSGDRTMTSSGESGDGHSEGSALVSVCFICAACLGAYAPETPGPAPSASIHLNLPLEPFVGVVPAASRPPTTLPRGPPLV